MKICFVGLGSIAKRHIENVKSLYPNSRIDVLRHLKNLDIPKEIGNLINNVYTDFNDMPDGYDVIFITNPTSKHYDTLMKLHDKGKHFFIEKPVFEKYNEDIDKINLRQDSVYYVACPLRYTAVIQYLKKNIDYSKVHSMRAISSSYLPEWRKGIDYRETYSAKTELGGGVSIDLIHEWDYIFYLIGEPLSTKSIISKKSNLEIDSDDLAIYIAEYADKLVEVHLDYFGRKAIRKLELFTDEDTIEADLISSRITYQKSGKVIYFNEERNDYQKREIAHFFDIIDRKEINENDIREACKVLKVTKGQ